MATSWICGEFDVKSCDSVETVAQRGIGVKIAWPWFYDFIVAIATACATMATHWVCGEFDAESCDGVETVA